MNGDRPHRPSTHRSAGDDAGGGAVFDVVRKSMHLIGRGQRGRWLALVGLAVVASGLEVVGALLVVVLLALVADPGGSEVDLPVVGDVRDLAGGLEGADLVLVMAAGMGAFFVLRFVFQAFVSYAQMRVVHNAGARLSKRLASGYLAMPYVFHLHRNTSDLIRTAIAASEKVVAGAFRPMIRVAADTILIVSLLAVTTVIAPAATLMAVLVVGGAASLLLWVVQPRLRRVGRLAHRLQQEMLGALQQSLQGLRDIKLLGCERFFARQYAESVEKKARASYIRDTINELPQNVVETALVGFILAVLGFAIATNTATEEVLSVLGLFAYVGLRLKPSLTHVVSGLNELKFASAAVDGVHEDLRLLEEEAPPTTDAQPLPLTRELAADGVAFRYDGADVDALRDIELTIKPGESLGLCGPTGGGKTTLVDLLTGLIEPTSGRLTVDGCDLREIARAWQRNLGVVSQMVFLIDDTLRRNIALGVPDEEIDDEALERAVTSAQLDEFIDRSAKGLDTIVGERGIRISGGQRQRIAIARALYRGAQVLVFDEGTSALDNSTEAQLMASLERLQGERTLILVAHRLSTVKGCDRIAYIEDGRIAGLGPYDRLIDTSEGFRELARASASDAADGATR